MELILIRTYSKSGTNGRLYKGNVAICHTIELPWKNNSTGISCIPEQRYQVKMRYSKRFGTHMILAGVEGRQLILIHPANDAVKELRGCIAPVTMITGEGKGSLSRKAFERVKALVMQALITGPVFITIKSKDHDSKRKNTIANTGVLQKAS